MAQLAKGTLETILLVEDDPAILKMVKVILEEAGFGVLSAGSANQARLIAEGFSRTIHLLLSDVMMPGRVRPGIGNRLEAASRGDARDVDVRFCRWSHACSELRLALHPETLPRFGIARSGKRCFAQRCARTRH